VSDNLFPPVINVNPQQQNIFGQNNIQTPLGTMNTNYFFPQNTTSPPAIPTNTPNPAALNIPGFGPGNTNSYQVNPQSPMPTGSPTPNAFITVITVSGEAAFNAIVATGQALGAAAVWSWNNIIVPVGEFTWATIKGITGSTLVFGANFLDGMITGLGKALDGQWGPGGAYGTYFPGGGGHPKPPVDQVSPWAPQIQNSLQNLFNKEGNWKDNWLSLGYNVAGAAGAAAGFNRLMGAIEAGKEGGFKGFMGAMFHETVRQYDILRNELSGGWNPWDDAPSNFERVDTSEYAGGINPLMGVEPISQNEWGNGTSAEDELNARARWTSPYWAFFVGGAQFRDGQWIVDYNRETANAGLGMPGSEAKVGPDVWNFRTTAHIRMAMYLQLGRYWAFQKHRALRYTVNDSGNRGAQFILDWEKEKFIKGHIMEWPIADTPTGEGFRNYFRRLYNSAVTGIQTNFKIGLAYPGIYKPMSERGTFEDTRSLEGIIKFSNRKTHNQLHDDVAVHHAIDYMLKSGWDFMKHMFDVALLITSKNTDSGAYRNFFTEIYKSKYFKNIPPNNPQFFGDSGCFMVRVSSIEIPQPISETFELKSPIHTIKKVRTKVSFERKGELKMLMDEPLFFLNIFNLISNNNYTINDIKKVDNRFFFRENNSSDQIYNINNLFTPFSTINIIQNNFLNQAGEDAIRKNIRIDLIVKHQKLGNYEFDWKNTKNIRRNIAVDGDTISPITRALAGLQADETPLWLFEDVNFLGEGSDISFDRDAQNTLEMVFPFVFKRVVKIDRSRRGGPYSYENRYLQLAQDNGVNVEWNKFVFEEFSIFMGQDGQRWRAPII